MRDLSGGQNNADALPEPEAASYATMCALLAMVASNQFGTGILILAADGHPATAAGFVTTTFAICLAIKCTIVPQMIRLMGSRRTPLAVTSCHATAAVLHRGASIRRHLCGHMRC
jgi:hypothetical protein